MKITKLLTLDSAPAAALLSRAKKIPLTYAQRVDKPAVFLASGAAEVENGLAADERPLEVGDVLVDEKGGFYVIEAADEEILLVSGDIDLMREAVIAFTARGIRIGRTDTGFSMPASSGWKQTLESAGLSVDVAVSRFEPLPLPRPVHEDGHCCCGHHHHHGNGECCGGHHHHHEEDECCCGGHHHHHEEDECCCGGHHHQHEEDECCCGGHHHQHEEDECCCGHHHHEEDGCCCEHRSGDEKKQ